MVHLLVVELVHGSIPSLSVCVVKRRPEEGGELSNSRHLNNFVEGKAKRPPSSEANDFTKKDWLSQLAVEVDCGKLCISVGLI